MSFTAYDAAGEVIRESIYYSVGGGFVVDDSKSSADKIVEDTTPVKYPFSTGDECWPSARPRTCPSPR